MVRLPRDVRPADVIRLLKSHGFKEIRQSGSYIILKHLGPPEFSVAIPNHVTIKVGTLYSVLSAVATHLKIDIAELIAKL